MRPTEHLRIVCPRAYAECWCPPLPAATERGHREWSAHAVQWHLPNGSSEPVYGDDDELVAFSEPAHAFRPARSVTTGASGRGVGEHPVGHDARSRDGVVLLLDGLLPGGHSEVNGGAHGHMQQMRSDNSSGVRPRGTRTRL